MLRPRTTIAIFAAVLSAATLAAVPTGHADSKGGTVRGKVTVMKQGKASKDHSKVVVEIKGIDVEPERMTAAIRQHDKTFVPELTVVTKNSVVEFPNDDKIFHNVFSLSKAARFDLGLYKSGSSKSVKLRRDGEITVYCNIHPEMVSKIKVVDTPYYAVTGKDGSFRIDDVPPGTYPITTWLPYGKGTSGTVTVTAGRTATIDFKVEAGKKPKQHLRKDGTPYGRYR